MLAIDEQEIVAGRFGDASDVAGTAQTHGHAERDIAGLHAPFDRVCEIVGFRHDAIPPLLCYVAERPAAGQCGGFDIRLVLAASSHSERQIQNHT
jgi:hypothetical protein